MHDQPPEFARARVLIVGAGPAGTACAIRLAQRGVKDVILVDSHDFPRDKTCGSGLSGGAVAALKALGVWGRIAPLAYPIQGIRVVTPAGHEAISDGGEDRHAFVCVRRVLDAEMLTVARERGVRFIPHYKAVRPVLQGERWVGMVDVEGRVIRADVVVVATGAHCKWTLSTEPKHTVHAIMGWWDDVPYRPNCIEMIWDRSLDGYYGWLFPEGGRRVNIGITYSDRVKEPGARELFQRFLDSHYRERLAGATPVGEWKGHPIVYGWKLGRLWSPGRVVIGEAGHMTNPFTSEGISQAMRSGILAADALGDVHDGVRSETEALNRYERTCARTFLPSFWASGAFLAAARTPVLDVLVKSTQSSILKNTIGRALSHL